MCVLFIILAWIYLSFLVVYLSDRFWMMVFERSPELHVDLILDKGRNPNISLMRRSLELLFIPLFVIWIYRKSNKEYNEHRVRIIDKSWKGRIIRFIRGY